MRESIRTKFLVLCVFLILVTVAGISSAYYMITKQDKHRESRQRIGIAFDIILTDFTKRVNTYTASVKQFLEENISLLWATYSYSLDDSEAGTIRFLSENFPEAFEELRQFGRVALADRVMLYGANKRLLAVYQRLGKQETRGGYLITEEEGSRYLPMDDPSVQAEITFRRNNLQLNYKNRLFPEYPLPPGVKAQYDEKIPDDIDVLMFQDGQQLGIRIVAPIYRREEKMGILVGEVFYTQKMIEEYASLSKTEINFFSGSVLSVGTLREQLWISAERLKSAASCQNLVDDQRAYEVFPITLGKEDYYQGQCAFKHGDDVFGAISVSLSQDIEKREIGKILQAVFGISAIGIVAAMVLVSGFVVPKFTRPIITLSNTAIRMAQGDLQQKIDTSAQDELGTLARSFAYMRNEIQAKIQELQELNAELDQRVERRTAEVLRQRYILDTFIKTVPDRIYFKDRQGRITRANTAHATRLGFTEPAQVIGKTAFDLFSPDDARRKHEQEQKILRSGIPVIGSEERVKWPDGKEEWSLTTKMPLRDEHGEIIGIFGISRDISALKETEEVLKHAKDAAEAANRAKSEFLANINHELRTPLNVILGQTQAMRRNPRIPGDERENLEIIYRSGAHLLALINTVLDMSKIESGRMLLRKNRVNLLQLLKDLENMFSLKTLQKHLQLHVTWNENLPQFICTDVTKLLQILLNLLNNAVKFTQQGSVSLDVGRGPEILDIMDAEEGAHPSSEQPIALQFSVTDTGPGIAPEEIEMIFEAFQQSHTGRQAQEGTGLGLTISQKFAHLMGGSLSVHSRLSKGTTFVLTIPVTLVPNGQQSTCSPERIDFLYDGTPEQQVMNSAQTLEESLTRSMLRALPEEIYSQLQQAVNVTDPEGVREIAEQIRAQNSQLAEALIDLTKQFRFDILQELFEHF